ncbi:MAG: O-antigen ligase family protein [Verrucomicrobiales bacterium]|nr:O-antigen ligase family protein [Verrucomicrobiales bacterium]
MPDQPYNQSTARNLGVWIFSVSIVYSALAYGTTTAVTRFVLDGILLSGFLATCAGRLGQKKSLLCSSRLIFILLGIQLMGSLYLLNPKARFNPVTEVLSPLEDAVPWLPGSYDIALSWPVVLHFACLSLALVALVDLMHESANRWKMLRIIAITGFGVAVIGIYQKASGAGSMLWTSKEYPPTFFAAFRYHGNAAAYLNLCWPAALAMLLRVLREDPRNILAKSFWISALAFTFGGLLVNTSKYGHAIAFVCMIAVLMIGISRISQFGGKRRLIVVITGVVFLSMFVILSMFSGDVIFARWDEAMNSGVSFKRRLLAYGTALEMWQGAPLWGYGPGSFVLLFRYFSVPAGKELGGKWSFAHNDYLQSLTEWGLAGSLLIFAVFGIGIWLLWKYYRRTQRASYSAMAALLGLLLVSLHIVVDFSLQIGAMQIIALVYVSFGWAGAPKRNRRAGTVTSRHSHEWANPETGSGRSRHRRSRRR